MYNTEFMQKYRATIMQLKYDQHLNFIDDKIVIDLELQSIKKYENQIA